MLNGIKHILNPTVGVCKLFAQQRESIVLCVLQFHQLVRNLGDQFILKDTLYCVLYSNTLYPVFLHRFLAAAQLSLGSAAFVIAINRTCVGFAALANHHPPTVAAKQLGGQQIFFLSLGPCRSPFVLFHSHLHPFKQILWDNTRYTVRDDDVFVPIFSDVFPVTQDTVKAVGTEWLLFLRQDMPFIQRSDNAANRFTLCISLVDLPHNRGGQWINSEMLVVGQLIAERNPAAVVFSLQRIFRKAPVDFLRQLR